MLDPQESLVSKFVKRGFWLYLFTFLAAPLSYAIRIILARDLGSVHDFGLFYGIISLLTLLSALNDLGATESLNYFLPKYLIKKEYGKAKYLLRLVFFLQLASSLIFIGIFYFFADIFAKYYFHDDAAAELLRIFSLYFLGINMFHVVTTIFAATQDTKLQKGSEFLRTVLTVIITIAIFVLDIGTLRNYVWAWISGIFGAVIFALYFAYTRYYRVHFRAIPIVRDTVLRKEFLLYAFPTFLTANIALILSQIDAQLVTVLIGNEAQGFYSNYLSVLSIPFIVITPLVAFLFPVITELYTRNRIEKMQQLHQMLTSAFIVFAIWISMFMIQVGTPFTILFYGEKYAFSGEILLYSAPFLIFNLLNQVNFQFLAGTGKAWSRTISLSVALPVNIVLNFILIHLLGVAGSALAVGISWIPLYFLTWYFTRSYQKIPRIKIIFLNIIACVISSGLIFLIQTHIHMQNIVFLGLACLTYFCIFCVVNFSLLREGIILIKTHRS